MRRARGTTRNRTVAPSGCAVTTPSIWNPRVPSPFTSSSAVYRASLHPDGLAARVVNLAEFGHHLLARLRHDVAVSADPRLAALLAEVEAYGTVRGDPPPIPAGGAVVVPMRLRHRAGELSLFTAITTFGTPVDVTVAELAVETFFPADAATAGRLHDLAQGVACPSDR